MTGNQMIHLRCCSEMSRSGCVIIYIYTYIHIYTYTHISHFVFTDTMSVKPTAKNKNSQKVRHGMRTTKRHLEGSDNLK